MVRNGNALNDRDDRDPRVRLAAFLDGASLLPLTQLDDSGVFAGVGRVEGVPVVAFANDPRRQGGAMGRAACEHIVRAYDVAVRERMPIVGLWHSGGARLAEGVNSLHGVGMVFAAMTQASGFIPQISVVLGPAAGGAAYGPALTDIVVLSDKGRIFVTGPDVVRSVTGEDVDMAQLGGPRQHARNGVAHIAPAGHDDAFLTARHLTTLLGHQSRLQIDDVTDLEFTKLLPESARRAYDVHPLIDGLLDQKDGANIELHSQWAPNIVTTIGRFGGRTTGVLANNPIRLAGCLDAAAAEKAARFVRMCDAFGVPLVVLVDVPGYLPGLRQEQEGVVRRGAKLLHAFAESTVPRLTLITRKAYGGAYIAMNSRALGATRVLAWPTAEVAVMGATSAVRILHRSRLAKVPEEERPALEAKLAEEQERASGGLDHAIDIGVVDEVIAPDKTRSAIARALAQSSPARGSHRNIPL